MVQTAFLSKYQIDQQKIVRIKLSEFLLNVAIDFGLIIIAFILWRYKLWVPTQKMKIPNVKTGINLTIGPETSSISIVKHIRAILKEMIGMGDNTLISRCGYEYFTYIFFLRRLCLLMAILIVTDICVWMPYCLFFQPLTQFSLITMDSTGNSEFRTFYTIWISCIMLYGLYDLKLYLLAKFMHRKFREGTDEQILLNNLKSKTIYMQFLGDHFIDQASIKSQMQQYLVEDMQQEDRIIAVQAVPSYQDLLEDEYRLEITKVISNYGVSNLSWIWRFFKQETQESIEEKKKQLYLQIQKKIAETYLDRNNIKSCMLIVSRIETAERLCREFQIGKALCTICPDFGYVNEDATWKVADSRMIVRWAQEPKDLIWVNMGEHKKELINFIIFNFVCFLLLLISFFFIALTSTDTYFKMPTIIGPAILLCLNSLIRFLISKMVEWEKKTLRSQWSMKEFKMTMAYLIINVILGSIVRDTLNVLGLLKTGWGWIELFSLIYKQADGLFYYIFILNQTAVSFFTTLTKPGQLFLDCYESSLWYDKVTKVKRRALYGRNDNYRLGYAYSLAFVVLAIVLIYSVSCPLIHMFGFLYFYSRMHLDTYSIIVFYEGEEQTSNLRMIEKVIQVISVLVGAWIFLTATSMIFSRNYSNAIVLYIFCGLVIYYAAILSKMASLKDARSDEIIAKEDIRPLVEKWKKQYTHPFNLTKYEILLDAITGRQAYDERLQHTGSFKNKRNSSFMRKQ